MGLVDEKDTGSLALIDGVRVVDSIAHIFDESDREYLGAFIAIYIKADFFSIIKFKYDLGQEIVITFERALYLEEHGDLVHLNHINVSYFLATNSIKQVNLSSKVCQIVVLLLLATKERSKIIIIVVQCFQAGPVVK